MGILEVLTIIFVVLKLVGIITWSWFWVVSPMFPAVLIYIVVIIIQVSIFKRMN